MHLRRASAPLFLALAALLACDDAVDPRGSAPSAAAPGASSSTTSSSAPATAALPPAPALPPPAPAPPLSARRAIVLAGDVEHRTNEAHVLADAHAHIETVASLYVLVAGDRAAPFDKVASLIQHTVDALYAGPLAHRPDHAVVFWLYSAQTSFNRGLDLLGVPVNEPPGLGLYDPGKRNILTWTDGAGAFSGAHEAAHPLFEADFPRAPKWLAEGAPALFEAVDFDPAGFHAKAHFRLQTLRDTLAGKDAELAASIRLDRLFAMVDDGTFRAAPMHVHYAMAREALRWLSSTGKLWDYYRSARESVLEDPTGVAAFTRVVGKSPADATAEWLAWIQSPAAETPTP